MTTSSKFTEVPTERPYEVARRTNETGYILSAVDTVLFGTQYQGVSVTGPKTGFFPNLCGAGLEGVPLYVVKAAERLALELFSPSTQLTEEVAA